MAIGENIYRAEVEWAKMVVQVAKLNLIRGKKIAAGTLFNSISYEVDPRTGEVTFEYEDYGDFVESGRKPGSKYPPPEAIAKWAKIKGLPRFRDKKGRFISDNSRTFLLQRAIAIKGIKPYPFLTDAVEQATEMLYTDLEDAVVADYEKSIDKLVG